MRQIIRFLANERGVALTEYLLLIALLLGGVLAAVIATAAGLNGVWEGWSGFFSTRLSAP